MSYPTASVPEIVRVCKEHISSLLLYSKLRQCGLRIPFDAVSSFAPFIRAIGTRVLPHVAENEAVYICEEIVPILPICTLPLRPSLAWLGNRVAEPAYTRVHAFVLSLLFGQGPPEIQRLVAQNNEDLRALEVLPEMVRLLPTYCGPINEPQHRRRLARTLDLEVLRTMQLQTELEEQTKTNESLRAQIDPMLKTAADNKRLLLRLQQVCSQQRSLYPKIDALCVVVARIANLNELNKPAGADEDSQRDMLSAMLASANTKVSTLEQTNKMQFEELTTTRGLLHTERVDLGKLRSQNDADKKESEQAIEQARQQLTTAQETITRHNTLLNKKQTEIHGLTNSRNQQRDRAEKLDQDLKNLQRTAKEEIGELHSDHRQMETSLQELAQDLRSSKGQLELSSNEWNRSFIQLRTDAENCEHSLRHEITRAKGSAADLNQQLEERRTELEAERSNLQSAKASKRRAQDVAGRRKQALEKLQTELKEQLEEAAGKTSQAETKAHDLEQQLDKRDKELEDAGAKLTTANTEIQTILGRLTTATTELTAAQQKVRDLEHGARVKRQECDDITSQLEDLRRKTSNEAEAAQKNLEKERQKLTVERDKNAALEKNKMTSRPDIQDAFRSLEHILAKKL